MGKDFEVNNIDISKPFEINFNKNKVIDEGFKIAFFQLIEKIIQMLRNTIGQLFRFQIFTI